MLTTFRHLLAPLLLAVGVGAAAAENYAERIAPLIDPAKLATLRERGANPRVQKYVAHLAEAKKSGVGANNVVIQAVALVGMKGVAAKLTADAMLRNLTIAERLGARTSLTDHTPHPACGHLLPSLCEGRRSAGRPLRFRRGLPAGVTLN
jgi:hypothetical protein